MNASNESEVISEEKKYGSSTEQKDREREREREREKESRRRKIVTRRKKLFSTFYDLSSSRASTFCQTRRDETCGSCRFLPYSVPSPVYLSKVLRGNDRGRCFPPWSARTSQLTFAIIFSSWVYQLSLSFVAAGTRFWDSWKLSRSRFCTRDGVRAKSCRRQMNRS